MSWMPIETAPRDGTPEWVAKEVEKPGGILIGPTWDKYGPGTERFDALVKSVATSATRVGDQSRHYAFVFVGIPRNLIIAQEKLRQAQRLLLGAEALLREMHRASTASAAEGHDTQSPTGPDQRPGIGQDGGKE
jgi:hypothetical protein